MVSVLEVDSKWGVTDLLCTENMRCCNKIIVPKKIIPWDVDYIT